jgi:hypothetical protein
MHLLSVSIFECERFEDARRILKRAAALNRRCMFESRICMFNLKRYDDTRACLEKAIALRPNFPTALEESWHALFRWSWPNRQSQRSTARLS